MGGALLLVVSQVRERDVEKRLRKGIEARGGMCLKFSSPQNAGVPDRLCIVRGLHFFVEAKAPGKKPTKLQVEVHRQMRAAGACVHVVDTYDGVDTLLKAVDSITL